MNHSDALITLSQARAAKPKAFKMFAAVEGFNGIGISCNGKSYGLKVNLTKTPTGDLPKTVEGVPIEVEIEGAIHKQGLDHA